MLRAAMVYWPVNTTVLLRQTAAVVASQASHHCTNVTAASCRANIRKRTQPHIGSSQPNATRMPFAVLYGVFAVSDNHCNSIIIQKRA